MQVIAAFGLGLAVLAIPGHMPCPDPPAIARAAGMTTAALAAAALLLLGLAVAGANPAAPAPTGDGPEDHDDRRDDGTDQKISRVSRRRAWCSSSAARPAAC